MFGFFKRLFMGSTDTLRVDGYWCSSSITLPSKTRTPLGSTVSVVSVCVDIDYSIEGSTIVVRDVRLSRGGGHIMGSDTAINIASAKTGEAWFAVSFSFPSLLVNAVQEELSYSDSGLRKIIWGRWRSLHQNDLVGSLVEALNSHASAEQISELINSAGRKNEITFTYTKPDGNSTNRRVTVRSVKGQSIRATDHGDGESKLFRIDRISNARQA